MPGHRSWRSSGRRPARSAFLHKLRRWPPEDSQNHLAGGRQPLTWPANAIPMELFIEITSFLSRSDVENLRAVNKEFELKLASQYFRNVVVPFNAELYTAQSNEARDGDHQTLPEQRPRRTAVQGPRDTKLSVLESMVRRAGFTEAQTSDAIETLLNTEGATLSGIEFDERAAPPPAPAPMTATPTAQDPFPAVTIPAPNPDNNVRRLTILQQRWGNPPATYSLQPKELTRGQLEMILEMDWAHRALIQSYVIAILDHSRASRFSSLTSLTIAKIPSSHINMFQRHDLWDSLPTLRNLTLAVVPDWLPTMAMDGTQPAFQPAVVFGSVAVAAAAAAANQVAVPTPIQVDESDSDDDAIFVSSGSGSHLPSQMSWAGFINHFTPGMTVEGMAAGQPAAGRPKVSGPMLRLWLPEGHSFRRERKSGLYKLKSISFKSCGYARHVEVNTITPIDSEEPWADHDVAMRKKELENFMQVCGDHGIAKIVHMLPEDDELHFGTTWNMTQGWAGVYDARKIRDAQMDGVVEPGRGRFSGFVTGPRPPPPTGL
ncbi:hypothetical protein VDBG_09370 [Verticillium alfalfae VaMs.102]|uniref:F-box domain-containing protein n=1 Tax=Verticillium alfalfae (strain VaMs.102 / ATCC MYA-4576 / FGSC 10136) TaxID=526221 RepID=C9SX70_VERA1|nr:hypothetical protein VDBG_09370 [Verticillium alfalfae VaMs.102]EEY23260.1 hypothetical protein VDBG_09370 [Verticillium alfalfae VaMs.102]